MAEVTTIHLVTDGDAAAPRSLLQRALHECGVEQAQIVAPPPITTSQRLRQAFRAAREARAIVAQALGASALRTSAQFYSRTLNVPMVDLLGPVIVRLADLLDVSPSDQPQLYETLGEDYFRRIEAIEFAVAHDDGLRPYELDRAEIVLVGVSRTSKTPLSMYLATHGWLVANVPLVTGVEPPAELFRIEPRKVFALTIRPERLALLRQVRLTRLGLSAPEEYASLDYVREDVRHAQSIYARGGWALIDVTAKAIEESANEVIEHYRRLFGQPNE